MRELLRTVLRGEVGTVHSASGDLDPSLRHAQHPAFWVQVRLLGPIWPADRIPCR